MTDTTVFVYTLSRTGEVGAWSRYTFPFQIDAFAQDAGTLYIRSGDDVLAVDQSALGDYVGNSPKFSEFTSTIQWPWLDMGQPGLSKLMVGFDMTASSQLLADVSIGYDESNTSAFTAVYSTIPDTVPGVFIPLTLFAPSFSFKVTFSSASKWALYAVTMYLRDSRPTA